MLIVVCDKHPGLETNLLFAQRTNDRIESAFEQIHGLFEVFGKDEVLHQRGFGERISTLRAWELALHNSLTFCGWSCFLSFLQGNWATTFRAIMPAPGKRRNYSIIVLSRRSVPANHH